MLREDEEYETAGSARSSRLIVDTRSLREHGVTDLPLPGWIEDVFQVRILIPFCEDLSESINRDGITPRFVRQSATFCRLVLRSQGPASPVLGHIKTVGALTIYTRTTPAVSPSRGTTCEPLPFSAR